MSEDYARAKLRAVLRTHSLAAFAGSDSLCACRNLWRTNESHREHLVDALLPVVQALVADELRAAAEWLNGDPDKGGAPYIAGDNSVLFPHRLDIAEVVTWAAASLRDRADALDPR